MENLGTFIQGQKIEVKMSTENMTQEEVDELVDCVVYAGVYKAGDENNKIMFSTKDETLEKGMDGDVLYFKFTLTSLQTKEMQGVYGVEVLAENPEKVAYPSETVITFRVEKRRISEVIA